VAVVARARPSVRALRAPLLRRACLALLVVAATAEAQPAVAPARLVAAQSEITFQVKQSGVPVDGRFRSFDAQIALDPKAPQTGSVTLSIDTASATVGFAESDAELPRSAWFQSSAIKAVGAGRLQVAGKLAIKGTSQELAVPVTIVQAGALSTATGEFIVKRLDFKIGENEWADVSLVANDVRVRFKLVLSGLGPLP
jgi:polyisoprenoid-binding protein YceI